MQLVDVVEHILKVLLVFGLLRLVAGNLLLCFCEFVAQECPVCRCDGQAQLQDLALLLWCIESRQQNAAEAVTDLGCLPDPSSSKGGFLAGGSTF
jgi:hypothetical protein